jgi:indole-3-glycerol phosphate synthase
MAATILDKIVATKRQEIAAAISHCSFENLQARLPDAPALRSFLAPLRQPGNIRLIAEVKKASPSKGLIREDFNPVAIAMAYQEAGASCLSVLTDEQYFQGSLTYLSAVRQAVGIPILRKEFILDRYQVLEARVAGADAVLLIAECLTPSELKDLYQYARSLGLHVLIELYDEENLNHVLDTGCELIGVNNRDLRTFEVDLQHVVRLRKNIPADRIVVAESGIASSSEAAMLYQHGIAAMLVGESLMRQADIVAATKALLATGFD